jgi:hypothetical protein
MCNTMQERTYVAFEIHKQVNSVSSAIRMQRSTSAADAEVSTSFKCIERRPSGPPANPGTPRDLVAARLDYCWLSHVSLLDSVELWSSDLSH